MQKGFRFVLTVTCIVTLQAALVVAVLNIQIPLRMGSLVNVVAGFTPGEGLRSYAERLSRPALGLCGLYLAQVNSEYT